MLTYEWVDQPGENQENYSLWNIETGVYSVRRTKAEAIEDFINNILDYTRFILMICLITLAVPERLTCITGIFGGYYAVGLPSKPGKPYYKMGP